MLSNKTLCLCFCKTFVNEAGYVLLLDVLANFDCSVKGYSLNSSEINVYYVYRLYYSEAASSSGAMFSVIKDFQTEAQV